MGLFGKKKTPAEILEEGRSQYVKGDLKKAFLTLHGLAAKGYPQACWYVGRIYLERKERSLAQSFLTAAAKGGVQEAASLLAKEFGVRDDLSREEAPAQSPKTAVELFREGEAAEKAGDLSKALSLFEQAAQMCDADAQFNCGLMYNKGQGTAADPAKALHWYEKAAQQGHAEALFNCGAMYLEGDGVQVDRDKAKSYFQQSAAQAEEPDVQEHSKEILREHF